MKLGLLRSLLHGRSLGVAWWLFPDQNHNSDGRHVAYLDRPALWRDFDPELFDGLKELVAEGSRNLSALERRGLLPGAKFFREPVPTSGGPAARRGARAAWFARLQGTFEDCDLIFLDPDNGLETKNFDTGSPLAGKSVALSELQALRRSGRALLAYHHQTRRAGGHTAELDHWGERLKVVGFSQVDAVRTAAYSPRAFFLLDADPDLRHRAATLAERGGRTMSWRPDLGSPPADETSAGEVSTDEHLLREPSVNVATDEPTAGTTHLDNPAIQTSLVDKVLRWYKNLTALARRPRS